MSRLIFLNSNSSVEQQLLSPRVFRMVENRAQSLRCVAVDGYPPPSVQVHVGRRDVSTEFKFTNSLSLTAGVRGLRHISIETERWNNEFTVTADDDDTVVKCVAVVPGLKPTLQLIQLHVHCKSVPSIDSCLLSFHKYHYIDYICVDVRRIGLNWYSRFETIVLSSHHILTTFRRYRRKHREN